MTITAEPEVTDPESPKRHRRLGLWVTLCVVAVLVVGGAITGTVWYRHYADAAPLQIDNTQLGWLPPDGALSHDRTAGSYTADIAPIREGKRQGFVFWAHNTSAVTQTVLGVYHPGVAGVAVSVSAKSPGFGPRGIGPWRSQVDIPPHSTRAVHYYVRVTSCNEIGGGQAWNDVDLRVRVGRFIRKETLSFNDFEYDLLATAATKHC